MKKSRPSYHWAAVLVGILHILVAIYGLLCGVCGGFYTLIKSVSTMVGDNGIDWAPAQILYLQQHVPGYSTMEWARPIIILFLGIMILIAGIGLFSMQGYGRALTFVCAVLMIFWQFVDVGHYVIFVIPAEKDWAQQYLAKWPRAQLPPEAREYPGALDFWFLANAGLFIGYSTISGGLLLLPGVGAAFDRWSEWRGIDPRRDPDDDDLYEPGRLKKSRRKRADDDDEEEDEED